MATITDNDNSDLLILEDDSSTDNMIIEENVINDDKKSSSDDLITFEKEPVLDITKDSLLDINIKDDNTNIDLSNENNTLDLGDSENSISLENNNVSLEEPVLDLWENSLGIKAEDEIIAPDINTDDAFSLSSDLENTGTEVQSVKEPTFEPVEDSLIDSNDLDSGLEIDSIWTTTSEWTMVDILDDAMNKLNSRSDLIANEINTEETNESSLKDKIIDLEWQVKVVNEKISDLKAEKALILKNTKSLERMKSADVISETKTQTSNRVHNVKRRK